MTAAYVPLSIDQGEDWTVQLVWTDDYSEPIPVVAPCRIDMKDVTGATVMSLETPETPLPDGEIPPIALSTDIGLIQLHAPKEQTAAIPPGQYQYDLFATVNDGDAYAGNQTSRLLYGTCTVNKRTTPMT